jgi:hypothetical protein
MLAAAARHSNPPVPCSQDTRARWPLTLGRGPAQRLHSHNRSLGERILWNGTSSSRAQLHSTTARPVERMISSSHGAMGLRALGLGVSARMRGRGPQGHDWARAGGR